ncbi:transposase [Kozakia baliensis]|uniref:transposase n=1 Tax=Kozakia baliensis TaxID=153496 RepID=UPI00191BF634
MIQGFLLEAGLGRGDLSETEWRVLKGLLPIDAANRGRGRRPEHNRSIINGILWRLHCGTPWRDVPPNMGTGTQFTGGSDAGAKPGSGKPSRSLWQRSWPTVATTASIAPPFAPTFRQRAEKGGLSTSSWPLAGRVHQSASLPG